MLSNNNEIIENKNVDNIIMIFKGKVIASGNYQKVKNNPEYQKKLKEI